MAGANKNPYNEFFRKSKEERTTFLLTETKQDCCFVFGPDRFYQPVERRLYSYKWMLSAVSPVFEAMFHGSFKESTSSMNIKIDDISYEDFEMFLNCIFRQTEEAHTWPKSFWNNLLYIVDKYMMPFLLSSLRNFPNFNDSILYFKWNKMQNLKSNIEYKREILSDPRLKDFDLSTFVEFMTSLQQRKLILSDYDKFGKDKLYKLIKAYIKQKGYDVNKKDMVRVCEKKDILKSHREIIEGLLHYVDLDMRSYLNDYDPAKFLLYGCCLGLCLIFAVVRYA